MLGEEVFVRGAGQVARARGLWGGVTGEELLAGAAWAWGELSRGSGRGSRGGGHCAPALSAWEAGRGSQDISPVPGEMVHRVPQNIRAGRSLPNFLWNWV